MSAHAGVHLLTRAGMEAARRFLYVELQDGVIDTL
jgi:hypothetical protein